MSTPGLVLPVAETAEPAAVALLGTGTVGTAVWERLRAWQGTPFGRRLRPVLVANSRLICRDCLLPDTPLPALLARATPGMALAQVTSALGETGCRIVIDATAADAVAACHADWLARGIHVVTANKRGQGAALARWRAIQSARQTSGAHYGDSATVGAGLPILRTLRALQAGGDRIHAIAGVLSGSLAWLLHQYDGLRPFSGFVRQAWQAGYTEPDPREDLSGEDVRRKLLILVRATGVALHARQVQVASLVPPALAAVPVDGVHAALTALDAPLRARYAEAWKAGGRLRYIARWQAGGPAQVGLAMVPADDPLAAGSGTDNRVAIWSDRYARQPLVLQGPGAGAEVTAAALLDDALAIQAGHHL
jgi:homoserine dehydrogenase